MLVYDVLLSVGRLVKLPICRSNPITKKDIVFIFQTFISSTTCNCLKNFFEYLDIDHFLGLLFYWSKKYFQLQICLFFCHSYRKIFKKTNNEEFVELNFHNFTLSFIRCAYHSWLSIVAKTPFLTDVSPVGK